MLLLFFHMNQDLRACLCSLNEVTLKVTSLIPSFLIACTTLKRKYKQEFTNVGFPKVIRNADKSSQSVLDGVLLINEDKKQIDRHLQTKHLEKIQQMCKEKTFKSVWTELNKEN